MNGAIIPKELPPLQYPFSDCHRIKADGSIRWQRRNFFISSALAGEVIGLNTLDSRYIQVAFAGLLLGLIDTEYPQYGLIRPKKDPRREKTTQLSAMSPV